MTLTEVLKVLTMAADIFKATEAQWTVILLAGSINRLGSLSSLSPECIKGRKAMLGESVERVIQETTLECLPHLFRVAVIQTGRYVCGTLDEGLFECEELLRTVCNRMPLGINKVKLWFAMKGV